MSESMDEKQVAKAFCDKHARRLQRQADKLFPGIVLRVTVGISFQRDAVVSTRQEGDA